MKWIIFFAKSKTSYYVYKLNKEDTIILNNNKKTIIVIDGIIVITKIFHNETKLPIAILEKNNIFVNKSNNKKTYYEIKAISNSYIIILNAKPFEQRKIKYNVNFIKNYHETVNQYEEIMMMMNQKSSKKRIILLILLIFIRFGHIYKNNIIISFNLSEKNIAIITNTSISTVSKIINNLDKININKKKNRNIQTLTIKKQT